MRIKRTASILMSSVFMLSMSAFSPLSYSAAEDGAPDYSDEKNWAYFGEGADKEADVFFVAPTVDTDDEAMMSVDDEKNRSRFLGALEMERGIVDGTARMYAPYYRQISLKSYALPEAEREKFLKSAYADVSDAFSYYLENENNGRPVMLFGFSQGADMCCRLLEEYFDDEKLGSQLVAAYIIGWGISEERAAEYPHLKFAQGEKDTGVIVSFDCEAPEVTDTLMCPAGVKTYSINPLNWRTDDAPADKSLNKGACFMKTYSKEIATEIPALCGCYIDAERGALKVTDVTKEDYPAGLDLFPEGSYHLYDYQFFFRNLQENAAVRLDAYNSSAEEVTTASETTASAQTSTTTASSSTAKQTSGSTSGSSGSPKTGDAGAAIPLAVIALAAGTAFVLRRKEQ